MVYVVSIFTLQKVMEKRRKFSLQVPLLLWNTGLCIFSIVGSYMTVSPQFRVLLYHGVQASVCGRNIQDGPAGVWSLLFILSKAPELIDTYFIVLRKQKLIFLHWYHHITVFVYCWYNYCLLISTGQWFIVMNYMVHSIMYGYYALRISRLIKLPIWVNMFITSLQLLQMVVGVAVNMYVFVHIRTDWHCDRRVEKSYFYVALSFIMYFSYFILFAQFFYSTYFKKQQVKKSVLSSSKCMENQGVENGYSPLQFATSELRHR